MKGINNNFIDTKANILRAASRLFGIYGYHGTTTRMIAEECEIDISTLHYHFGEKIKLFNMVILNLNSNIRALHKKIEKLARGKAITERIEIAVDNMSDFYFEFPEYAYLAFQGCFLNLRENENEDIKLREDTMRLMKEIAYYAFHYGHSLEDIPQNKLLTVIGLTELLHLYVMGRDSLYDELSGDLTKDEYKLVVKNSVKELFNLYFNSENI